MTEDEIRAERRRIETDTYFILQGDSVVGVEKATWTAWWAEHPDAHLIARTCLDASGTIVDATAAEWAVLVETLFPGRYLDDGRGVCVTQVIARLPYSIPGKFPYVETPIHGGRHGYGRDPQGHDRQFWTGGHARFVQIASRYLAEHGALVTPDGRLCWPEATQHTRAGAKMGWW